MGGGEIGSAARGGRQQAMGDGPSKPADGAAPACLSISAGDNNSQVSHTLRLNPSKQISSSWLPH
jgi:hypothetical protein